MDEPNAIFEPVAIVLRQIEIGPRMRFVGTDLESGAMVSVVVETTYHQRLPAHDRNVECDGLVLMLTIETFLLDL
jgi:hypothetical protein